MDFGKKWNKNRTQEQKQAKTVLQNSAAKG